MGCNAWNHPSYCQCGWGGDTGGGYGGRSRLRYVPAEADGTIWSANKRPTHASYVNPNALCPVCSASVFFYQSPYGGRVFFDELGPPWPKHGCTDNGASQSSNWGQAVVALEASRSVAPPHQARSAWRPLLVRELEAAAGFDRIKINDHKHLPGTYLYVPVGWVDRAPAYWRWCQDDPGLIEISCIRVNENDLISSESFRVASWLRDDEQFASWRAAPGADLPADALNAIGFAHSFGWKTESPDWYVNHPSVDFQLARVYFERSAALGFWAAINNLGVIYRDGLGVAVDHVMAFSFFYRAAQSLEPISMRHLAHCYREGLGCERDAEMASFLEELIVVQDDERSVAT
jgi:TPR repeat protein